MDCCFWDTNVLSGCCTAQTVWDVVTSMARCKDAVYGSGSMFLSLAALLWNRTLVHQRVQVFEVRSHAAAAAAAAVSGKLKLKLRPWTVDDAMKPGFHSDNLMWTGVANDWSMMEPGFVVADMLLAGDCGGLRYWVDLARRAWRVHNRKDFSCQQYSKPMPRALFLFGEEGPGEPGLFDADADPVLLPAWKSLFHMILDTAVYPSNEKAAVTFCGLLTPEERFFFSRLCIQTRVKAAEQAMLLDGSFSSLAPCPFPSDECAKRWHRTLLTSPRKHS
jgi:hypothetical protein